MPYLRSRVAAVTTALALSVTAGTVTTPAFADQRETEKTATATGYGGAVSTVDPEASAAAIEILRGGGNAADAAVAAAATLGVTEPYSAGVGGGGYFVFYSAHSGHVSTIDGRETAPAAMPHDAFIDPKTGKPYNFTPELVTSGVSVGVPGTPATWERALDRWGTKDLDDVLEPAIDVADRGFVVDDTFRQQTLDNKLRFAAFTSTSKLFLPGGDAPAVGSIFRNPDLAATYRLLADKGTRQRDSVNRPGPAEDQDHQAARPRRPPDHSGPRQVPRPGPVAHPRRIPRPGRLRHGTVEQRRHHGGRGAEHP
jgi:gamma-glutamyltranspeptidase/glutathione hydrolase